MKYNAEAELYPEVITWLSSYLKHKYPKAKVNSYDTSRENLSDFLRRNKLNTYINESETFVIKVDITGVALLKNKCLLSFVECKLNPITLKDVSQIIGYSKVVHPVISWIVSPAGISSPVNKLINIYKRYDILTYKENLKVKIAQWNGDTKDINFASLLPPGEHA